MQRSASRLADQELLSILTKTVARECANTAELLDQLGEVDERRLYLPKGYPSMHEFCVDELGFSEGVAFKRIQAARVAIKHPSILDHVARGHLNVTAVVLLAPHLMSASSGELLEAAARKSCAAIKLLLAERFPRPDVATRLAPIGVTAPPDVVGGRSLCESAEQRDLNPVGALELGVATGPVQGHREEHSPVQVAPTYAVAKVEPRSVGRFALRVTLDQEAHDLLRYAQALLGHALPSGDISEVLKRSLRALVQDLEKQRFAATSRSRLRRTSGPKGRYVPAEVRRKVWQRDGGQCTFVSESGRRCESRKRLEFDHADPVARGGQATVQNLRLRCRAHNQYAAECVFGTGFMQRKREAAGVRQPISTLAPNCARRVPPVASGPATDSASSPASPPRATRPCGG